MDAVIIALSYILSVLVVNVIGGDATFPRLVPALFAIIAFKVLINFVFGIYNIILRYIDLKSIAKIVVLTFATNMFLVFALLIPSVPNFMHKSVYLFITTFEVVGLVGYRIFGRLVVLIERRRLRNNTYSKNTLIIGAGSAGELALKEIEQNKELNNYVVGFLDDDESILGRRISDKQVLGKISDIKHYIDELKIEEVILAINNMPKRKTNELLNLLSDFENINVKRISIINDYKKEDVLKIIDVKVEDLLERDEITLDNEGLEDFIKDENVLVTGGGGSIGSELSRQIFNLRPKKLIIFDIYENNAYDIQMELQRLKYKDHTIKTKLIVLIGSVYNKKRLEEVFIEHKPSIIFHAAAYKHVPLMEDSPVEAIRTNVIGTNNTASLANKYNVKKMVLVSSDKAVRPTNVMGATKRYAELIIGYHGTKGNTRFSSVRFGNVLGSNGSVIPLFKKQIEDGGPLTVTHSEITRYFMTIPESVSLILQSAVYAKGGEIFILDMGQQVKIYDLAIKMIMLSGLKPHVDIEIDVVGLRPGEKLYEELLVDHNSNDFHKTEHSRIFIEKCKSIDYEELDLDYVMNNYEKFDNEHIKEMLSRVITSYVREDSTNE